MTKRDFDRVVKVDRGGPVGWETQRVIDAVKGKVDRRDFIADRAHALMGRPTLASGSAYRGLAERWRAKGWDLLSLG